AAKAAGSSASSRHSFLLSWRSLGDTVPEEIKTFEAIEDESAYRPDAAPARYSAPTGSSSSSSAVPSDRALFGSKAPAAGGGRDTRERRGGDRRGGRDRDEAAPREALPMPGANAFRKLAVPQGREAELKRNANSLLNKICPENVATIAAKLVELKVANTDELEQVIGLIMKKSLSEPHYCETYADL
ncbi:unnamed protein product, partial [Polarella glacialis]